MRKNSVFLFLIFALFIYFSSETFSGAITLEEVPYEIKYISLKNKDLPNFKTDPPIYSKTPEEVGVGWWFGDHIYKPKIFQIWIEKDENLSLKIDYGVFESEAEAETAYIHNPKLEWEYRYQYPNSLTGMLIGDKCFSMRTENTPDPATLTGAIANVRFRKGNIVIVVNADASIRPIDYSFVDNVAKKIELKIAALPPETMDEISLINRIISLKEEAFKKGWIDNQGIANSLNKKFENAKMKIIQGQKKAAKNILEASINELDAQWGKHINDQAYYSLTVNIEVLIDKLQ